MFEKKPPLDSSLSVYQNPDRISLQIIYANLATGRKESNMRVSRETRQVPYQDFSDTAFIVQGTRTLVFVSRWPRPERLAAKAILARRWTNR
jgi:hypothetical protein